MKNLIVCLALLTAAGCKKKTENAPAPAAAPTTGDTKPAAATKPAEPAAAPKAAPFEKSGIAECDAVLESYAKFSACTKIKEEDRVVQDMNVSQLKDIIALPGTAAADQKELMQKAAVTQCKQTDDKLKELNAANGC